jgi:NDP-sugar pyrophosphorylase family protein
MEKPTRHYHVSTGIYALSKRILQYADFKSTGRLDMPDLIRGAVGQGCPVLCYTQDNIYWRDIGRFDHYEAASKDFEEAPERFLKQAKVTG